MYADKLTTSQLTVTPGRTRCSLFLEKKKERMNSQTGPEEWEFRNAEARIVLFSDSSKHAGVRWTGRGCQAGVHTTLHCRKGF